MKKILIILVLSLSIAGYSQTTPSVIKRVATSTTTFTSALSAGNLLFDVATGKMYKILRAVAGTSSLSTLTRGTDYIEVSYIPGNDEWLPAYDYTGTLTNFYKITPDNTVRFAFSVEIGSLYIPADVGMTTIANVPVVNSTYGTAHGYKLKVDDTDIVSIQRVSDGAGSTTTPTATVTAKLTVTDSIVGVNERLTGKISAANGVITDSLTVADRAYDATTWNGSNRVPTSNAVRDKIESLATTLSLTGIRDSLSNVYDSLAVHRDTLWNHSDRIVVLEDSVNAYASDLSAIYDSLLFHRDTLTDHSDRLVALERDTASYLTAESDPIWALDSANVLHWADSVSMIPTKAFLTTNHYTKTQANTLLGAKLDTTNATVTMRSNWTSGYNDKINSASFGTSTGTLTLTQQDGGTVTTSLDGRYSLSSSANLIANDTWFGSYDNIGNSLNAWKISKDNYFTLGASLDIGSLNQMADVGMITLSNIPVVSSLYGTAHGYRLRIDDTDILSVQRISDGAGGTTTPTSTLTSKLTVTDTIVGTHARFTGNVNIASGKAYLINADTLPVTSIKQFTSASLKGRVTDETGSGALMFATVPTVTDSLLLPLRAYNATTWNNSKRAVSEDGIRDKIESLTADGLGGANKALSNLSSVEINTSLLPGTSDGAALGSTSKQWSDLYLASGGIIDWANGDVKLTHSSKRLTLDGILLVDSTFRAMDNIKAHSSEVGKTEHRIELDASDADNMRIYAYDLTGSAYKPLRIGGVASASGGLYVASDAVLGSLSSTGFNIPSGALFQINSDTLPLTSVKQFSSATLKGRLTDETGTGVAVFGTNPTLTGATISGNVLPSANNTYDLGSLSYRYQYVYSRYAYFGDYAQASGVVLNNTTSPSYLSSGMGALWSSSGDGKAYYKDGNTGTDYPINEWITVKKSYSADSIKYAYERPLQLVAAPGLGKTIVMDWAASFFRVNYSTDVFGDADIRIYAASTGWCAVIDGYFMNQSSTITGQFKQDLVGIGGSIYEGNYPLYFWPDSDFTTGGGSIDIYIIYRIVTL